MRGNCAVSSLAPVRADGKLLRGEIGESLDRRRLPRDANADVVVGAAEPGEVGALESGLPDPEQRIEAGAAADDAEGGAVFRGDLGQPVGEPQAAGAFHVLGDDRRIAGNMAADEASHHAPIGVIAAAGAIADVERHRLAFVEIGRRLRAGRSRQHQQRGKRRDGRDERSQHGFSSRCIMTYIAQIAQVLASCYAGSAVLASLDH